MALIKTDSSNYENAAAKIREKTNRQNGYKPSQLPSGIEDVFEAGKKAESDAFWEAYQKQGERTNYEYAFADNWTNDTFKPKYDIVPVGDYAATCMFQKTSLDIPAGLAHNGVKLDLSQCTSLSSTFLQAMAAILPPIDMQSCTRTSLTFYNTKITQLYINNLREDCTFDRTFLYNATLVDFFVTGTIGENGFNVQQSRSLTKQSIMSIINALADKSADTSGTVWKVTIGETNRAKLTAEEIEIAEQKGWTIE